MQSNEYELYRQEVIELTTLMREDFSELQDFLKSEGVEINKVYLISYLEDEEGGEYGVILCSSDSVLKFQSSDHKHYSIERMAPNKSLGIEFPQLEVALDMLQSSGI